MPDDSMYAHVLKNDHSVQYLLTEDNSKILNAYCVDPIERNQVLTLLAKVVSKKPSNEELNEWFERFSIMAVLSYTPFNEYPSGINDMREAFSPFESSPALLLNPIVNCS